MCEQTKNGKHLTIKSLEVVINKGKTNKNKQKSNTHTHTPHPKGSCVSELIKLSVEQQFHSRSGWSKTINHLSTAKTQNVS